MSNYIDTVCRRLQFLLDIRDDRTHPVYRNEDKVLVEESILFYQIALNGLLDKTSYITSKQRNLCRTLLPYRDFGGDFEDSDPDLINR